ncbi:MAG: hypothetical protein A2509_09500 [Candidatus Edwardsbacteria bacterium RIFOXYD12_FULL_50_11]|uniref:Nucleoside 2-deoxyribosyltransferase n=1 Tax=Candidatus Edwardsbacteria bacterium GWF2_54_11 TaxID=1817851 RepID=A0A1F5RBT6_9BACT|nr:MAG: hypothetical protein A2502_08370 [Candidatus Edwardsbacteria bacterium RifOxyC12_full_54_24]OGF07395.1 MAG: hypothetical protein A2273_02685 [Candidatus Edwardsbacteria bacterium RifOxyA12_full_54_48]OGF09647.1 MAG: hypothetical protein A3K15_09095 [Candidatus Edwardsbacteria bacterium GWE2_54_12]OGF11908.1 MAG: hypothetical protein A2024_02645 [Candidatus Edwardsbacteria bacterium GWF2_54_11]OGF18090.1 MAG: hypothetical protein A2509_09500 [Candidatus Edwardsbacteria bacterium RIFOXYD1
MKFYVAAYVREKRRVKDICRSLELLGHKITVDWTKDEAPKLKDRSIFSKDVRRVAVRDMKGVLDCDIFIILSDPVHGRAKYVELGAAIASFEKNRRPLIYALGKTSDQTVFYYHPVVKRVKTLDDIICNIRQSKEKTRSTKQSEVSHE